VSPQRSNRVHILEGVLRCLERMPPERVTSRVIAKEAGASLASIGYHFGSKENLVTEAVIEGLDRWLASIAEELAALPPTASDARFRRAMRIVAASREQHSGLAKNFVGALARAQHDARVRRLLAAGFRRTRPRVAAILGLGADRAGHDAAGLVLALFDGLLIQTLIDPGLAIEGKRMERACALLRTVLS
jgi:AcrR family transcriptional regulator